MDYEPLPSSIRSARLFVVDRVQQWRRDDLVDSVALLTSELVTNAVVHTGRPFTVHVSRSGGGVRVEVADLVHDLPVPPETVDLDVLAALPGAGSDARRVIDLRLSGLQIVARAATAWGSDPIPGDGKVVWFEVGTERCLDVRDGVPERVEVGG